MNGRYENGALPEKVRLLYEAVLAMVTDGWDINRMKSSLIAAVIDESIPHVSQPDRKFFLAKILCGTACNRRRDIRS